MQLTAHFTLAEAACRCGCRMPADIRQELQRTAEWAEQIRAILGEPMRVLSWYRCSVYNRQVGGAPNSQHLLGRAIDFACKVLTPRQVQARLQKHYPDLIRGLGRYRGFSHIDRRLGRVAMWEQRA